MLTPFGFKETSPCARSPATREAWWERILQQISVAKKSLREGVDPLEENPAIPIKYVRFHAILHEKNLASMAYVGTIHHLRGSFNPRIFLKPINIAPDLEEAEEYFKKHKRAIEIATAAVS